MKVSRLFLTVFCGVVLGFGSASAQIMVSVGKGHAHDCFVYAKAGISPRDGVAVCDQALKEDALTTRDQAATYDNRGVMLDQLGMSENAASDFHMASTLNQSVGDPHVNLGSILIKQRRYSDALDEINKGLDLGMSFPHIGYYDRAIAEEMLGSYKEAYHDFKKVLKIEPDYAPATERLKDFTVTIKPIPGGSSG